MSKAYENPEFVAIGRVVKPHGVRGEIRVQSLTVASNRFLELERVFLSKNEKKIGESIEIEGVRFHKDQVLIKFEGLDNRNDIEKYRSHFLFVPFEETIQLEQGEFFLFELEGMAVKTEEGELIGELVEVIQTGANDVFVVRGEMHGEILIPDIEDVVKEVNGETREVTVHLIPGLI